jgi:hypothetical protein
MGIAIGYGAVESDGERLKVLLFSPARNTPLMNFA